MKITEIQMAASMTPSPEQKNRIAAEQALRSLTDAIEALHRSSYERILSKIEAIRGELLYKLHPQQLDKPPNVIKPPEKDLSRYERSSGPILNPDGFPYAPHGPPLVPEH